MHREEQRQLHMLPDEAKVQDLLNRTGRILPRRTKDKNKLYTVYAPEVECISKGKARTPYEFGVKVDIATTLKEGLVVAIADIKMDGRLGRNPLKGALGDALHAVR